MPFLGLRQNLDEDFLRCNKGIDEEGAKYSHICGKVEHHATFVKYVPPPSEAVRGNARVGCGKATMANLLCGVWLERNQDARCRQAPRAFLGALIKLMASLWKQGMVLAPFALDSWKFL